MAITIDSNPDRSVLAYKPIRWVVSSDDPNIVRCICDVYKRTTYFTTIEKDLDLGSTDTFTFDVASILRDMVFSEVPDFSATTVGAVELGNAVNKYELRFFEVIQNGTTFDTSWAEDGAGTSYKSSKDAYSQVWGSDDQLGFVINGSLLHQQTFDSSSYLDGGDYRILSRGYSGSFSYTYDDGGDVTDTYNKPKKIKFGDILPYAIHKVANSNLRFEVKYINAQDELIAQFNSASTTSNSKAWLMWIDTTVLGAIAKKLIASASAHGGSILYDIVEDCNDYISFYWQNSVGGMDYYLFRNAKTRVYESDTETYVQHLDSNYNNYDFSETVLKKQATIAESAISDVLDRTDAEWLREIITHSVRAWVYKDGEFIPVIVADGQMVTIDSEEGLYQLELELLFSNKVISQQY